MRSYTKISLINADVKLSRRVISRFTLGAFVLFLSVILGCEETRQTGDLIDTAGADVLEVTPLIDSNTNWLLICSEDADCDEGVCSCGSCVFPCDESSGCSARPADTSAPLISCSRVDPVSESDSCGEEYQGPMTRICLPQCETDTDCPEELVCHQDICKRPRRGERRPPVAGMIGMDMSMNSMTGAMRLCAEGERCLESGERPERCAELCAPPEE